jgi:asparagine synthase (glutamine-hydrolysing)
VIRSLAGALDPGRQTQGHRLLGALSPGTATIADHGSLRVAYTGGEPATRGLLCLLDGYLDNAPELRAELPIHSDTGVEELLARAWRRWGRGLLPRMRGDFVLLLWDLDASEGLLARDQLGARCLYLCDVSGALCFASEIPQLLALLPRRPQPDAVGIAHWLTMSNRPGAATLYAGVRRLNPGSMLLLGRDGVREERYWTPRFLEPAGGTREALAAQVRIELDRAVRRRISPDSATGVMMSGGLDSACVAAATASAVPAGVRACSAVFPEHPAVDEAPLIHELRAHLRLPGIVADVRAGGLLASALEALAAWQLPLRSWGDFWALPLLRGAAAAGVGTMLGGDGGDEVFGVRAYLLADRLRDGHPLATVRLARELPGAGDKPPRGQLATILATVALGGALPYSPHGLLHRRIAPRELPGWLLPGARGDLLASQDPLAWKRLDGPRWWASAAHGLTRGIEELGMFEHHRQRAAAAGLQARHPLLDLDLVALALRLPPLASFDRYRNRPLLRAALAGRLPDSVRRRPGKALFDSLVVDSLAGADGPLIRRLLTDPGAEIRAYVDQRRVRRDLLDSDRLRRERPFDWMCQVWRLTTAECWLRAQADPGNVMLLGGVQASPPQVSLRLL